MAKEINYSDYFSKHVKPLISNPNLKKEVLHESCIVTSQYKPLLNTIKVIQISHDFKTNTSMQMYIIPKGTEITEYQSMFLDFWIKKTKQACCFHDPQDYTETNYFYALSIFLKEHEQYLVKFDLETKAVDTIIFNKIINF